jgi:acid stress-induced BolA-like protein IbaG/YrbA
MANIKAKIINALLEKFSSEEIRLEDVDSDKVLGFIVSDKFISLDEEARQDMIWEHLRKYLNSQERTHIIALIALTQEEEMAYSD